VRTAKLCEEEAAGHAIYRGFGTRFPGDMLRRGLMLEPPINVSVYTFAEKLLAFGEQAIPYELDPASLETIGEFDFHGRLTEVTPFAAHPKFDVDTGHMLNFGIAFSPTEPMLNLYEFSCDGHLIRRRRHPLRFQHSNHDFAITRNYAVFHLSPLIMDFSRFWGEHLSVMESLSWEPDKGSRILIMPRESKKETAFEIEAGRGHCLHLINCFESDGRITVDIMELINPAYPQYQPVPDMFATVAPGSPVRFVIDLESRSLVKRTAMSYDSSPDFPSLDRRLIGRPYSDFWILGISASGKPGRKFFDQLAHGSWKRGAVEDIYQTAPGQYLGGEPCPVSNPENSNETVIINEYFDAEHDRCEILLFEATHVAKGPIARLGLRHKIHLGFHTSFHQG
jgi:all-trans-8'-apo-beta-carotenal 15,15'-oxygenase